MPFNMKAIKGISTKTENKLIEIGIDDMSKLRAATETHQNREEVSQKIKEPIENVYIWAKQAELMKVEGISADDADLLIQCGIRDIVDLINVNTTYLLKFMKTMQNNKVGANRLPAVEEIEHWKINGKKVVSQFEKNETDQANEFLVSLDESRPATSSQDKVIQEKGFFSDLSEVITEIGVGIAGAQHQLDLSAIDIQNKILENEELAAYGVNATWYTIPEVNFTLKMEYMMVEESSNSGSVSPIRKLFISPSNAKYNNYFKSTMTEESSLSLRIVPVPPPERFTERIIMPDLIGMTKEEAEEELNLNRIAVGSVTIIKGKTGNQKISEVTYQSIQPGKVLLINQKPELKVTLDE